MKINRIAKLAAATTGLALFFGCQPAQKPVEDHPVVKAPVETDVVGDTTHRVNGAVSPIAELQTLGQQLPGHDESQHRQIIEQCFADIATILPLLQGPETTGAFRQQLSLVQGARTQLQSLGQDLSADPTISTGLRATFNALTNIDEEQFSDHPEIAKPIGVLGARLDQLDTTHTAMANQIEAEAVRQIADAMQQMQQVLKLRMGNPQPKPAPRPMTAPPIPPRPAPATRP